MKINKYYLKNKETVCKKARERIIKIKYNFSIEEYEELRSLQKYKCKICKKDEKSMNSKLHIDHNHKTGKIRGLLCGNCNRGIGCFKENINYLKNSINYLSK
jgi:hypothetical protein